MAANTVINALAGGILIGSAAALLLWLNGRIAGVSGVIGSLVFSRNRLWPALFLGGIVAGAGLFYALGGAAPAARSNFPLWLLAVAGVLVGFGTSLARGCTSGHGVCGLGRLSLRSLAATLTFLTFGLLTAFVVRHIFGVI